MLRSTGDDERVTKDGGVHCNEPHAFAAIAVGAAFAGCACAIAVVILPAAVARRLPPGEDRHHTTIIAQTVAAASAAVFFGVLAILAVTFLAGGLRLCR